MTRLHVVDGTYELFRAHFSKRPPHPGPDGRDLKASVGVASSLLGLLGDEAEGVTHLAVAFDNPIRSFRNALFGGYKDETGVEPALLAQFDLVEEVVRALGVTVWSMREHEADDALATAAVRFGREVDQVRIVASDKDLLQVLEGERVVMVDRVRDRVLDAAGVQADRGVSPAQIPDLLALVGDDADGIPGLEGFGAMGAAVVLRAFGSIEEISTEPGAWPRTLRGVERLCRTFAERREDALLYKKLATLVQDVPLRESLEELEWRGAPREAWHSMCERLGSSSLRDRPRRWR